jgi:hypothetical protein
MYIEISCYGDFNPFRKILETLAGPKRDSFIDLCCYDGGQTKYLDFKEKTFVDVIKPDGAVYPGKFIETDVLGDHPVFQKRYGVAYCLDGIEHLHKTDGYRLLQKMESISDRQILFTPLGEYMVNPHDPHPHSHKSGWYPGDAEGYGVVVAPNWHPTLNVGAFFMLKCPDIENEFKRIRAELSADPYFQVVVQ